MRFNGTTATINGSSRRKLIKSRIYYTAPLQTVRYIEGRSKPTFDYPESLSRHKKEILDMGEERELLLQWLVTTPRMRNEYCNDSNEPTMKHLLAACLGWSPFLELLEDWLMKTRKHASTGFVKASALEVVK